MRIILIFLLLIPSICFGADYYIDPDAGVDGSGTFASPWNTWSGKSISTNNDYRQKCGTSYTGAITITAVGNSGDYIIIGAYYDSGGAVHEDDSPTFGQNCGNAAAKPEVRRSTIGTGEIFATSGEVNQYIEFNSLKLTTAESAIVLHSSYNKVRYCYLYNLEWGVRFGTTSNSDYNTIEYNLCDINDASDEDQTIDGDCVALYGGSQNNTIQYNHMTGFDHFGVFLAGGDSNTVQYNYIYETDGHEDVCIGTNPNGDSNIVRFNYCKDAGIGWQGGAGDDNEIYGNVFTCGGSGAQPASGYGCIHIYSYSTSSYTNDRNKFYNNVIYNNDDASTNRGIYLLVGPGNTATIEDNEFYNNIILTVGGECIRIDDATGTPVIAEGDNEFFNNSCYDYLTNEYAEYGRYTAEWAAISISTYTDDGAYNASGAHASGNIDTDPGLSNPTSYELWPDSASDNVVGNGYNLGTNYDDLLDSDATDFTATPPTVMTETQPANWIIGAYGVEDGSEPPPATESVIQGGIPTGGKIN